MSDLQNHIIEALGEIPKSELISSNIIDMLKHIPDKEKALAIICMIEIAIDKAKVPL